MPTVHPADPPYERLEAWRASHELALVVYRATRTWPASERFGLIPEVRVAAVQVATSLIELSTSTGARHRTRAVQHALGALARLSCLLLIARDVGVIEVEDWRLLDGFTTRAGQLSGGLHRALRKQSP